MMFFSADLLDEVTSLWFQAPMVISNRLQDFAMVGLGGGAVEIDRMVTEKLAAGLESVFAVNAAVVKEAVAAASGIAAGTFAGMTGASDRLAVAALKPYGERVRANALRLGK